MGDVKSGGGDGAVKVNSCRGFIINGRKQRTQWPFTAEAAGDLNHDGKIDVKDVMTKLLMDELELFLKFQKIPKPEPSKGGKMHYKEYLEVTQTGDVLLFSGTDTISKAIRWFTGGGYHHTGLVFKGKLPGESDDKADKVRVFQALSEGRPADEPDEYKKHTNDDGVTGVQIDDLDSFLEYEGP